MPQRGLGSGSVAVRPYFLEGTRLLSAGASGETVAGCGRSGLASIFLHQVSFAFLCEELHIRGHSESVCSIGRRYGWRASMPSVANEEPEVRQADFLGTRFGLTSAT